MKILRTTEIDKAESLKICIGEYCKRQKLRYKTIQGMPFLLKKSVRQNCMLSPVLFNLYLEIFFRKALSEVAGGIKVNNYNINNIRYANDIMCYWRTI